MPPSLVALVAQLMILFCSWWQQCVIPLSPLGLVLFRLFLPFMAMAELWLAYLVSRLAMAKCCRSVKFCRS